MKCDCCVRWKRTSSLFNSVLRVACQPRAREGHFKQLVLPVSNIISIFICLNNGQQKLLKLLLGGFSALAAKEIITEIIAEAITSETQESSPNNQTSLWNFYLLSAATFFFKILLSDLFLFLFIYFCAGTISLDYLRFSYWGKAKLFTAFTLISVYTLTPKYIFGTGTFVPTGRNLSETHLTFERFYKI